MAVTDLDLDAIRERSQWALSHIHEVNSHYASAQDVPALLARIAELESDLACAREWRAEDDEAAERRGYERAVARLRDDEAFMAWLFPEVIPHRDNWRSNAVAADYLDAVKESNDG